MTSEREPWSEGSRIVDRSSKGNLRGGDALVRRSAESPDRSSEQEHGAQDASALGRIAAVSQPTGLYTESTSPRRGPIREQGTVVELPHEGPAGMRPGCSATRGGVIVVGAGESPAQGEGPQEPSRESALGDDKLATECQIRPGGEGHRTTVPDLQQRLAQKAVECPQHRFGHLYDLLLWDSVLDAAATRLLANKGSRTPGLDGLRSGILRGESRVVHLARLKEQLIAGTFQPMPVKRVYIPKKNGKMRPLGIPTLYDRWVQMALKLILEPIFESDFANFSHGFRPGRSCHTAIAQAYHWTMVRRRHYDWVIEGDIQGFFDHVHHQKLLSLLRERIRDRRLLDLIWRFLRAGVMEGQLFKRTSEGTPQGGVLSPLLANIYLNHFDRWFARRAMLANQYGRDKNRKAGHANFLMVRYADDFVVFSNGTKEETAAFKQEMKDWLASELRLTLSEEKTAITHFRDGFDFLGFTLKKTEARGGQREVVVTYPSTESVQRAVRHITDMTARDQTLHSHEDQIRALNAFMRGWGEYFRHSSAKHALAYVSSHAHMRLWRWLLVKDTGTVGQGYRRIKAKYYDRATYTWKVGNYRLMKLASMKIDYVRHRVIPHPYLTGQPVQDAAPQDPFHVTWDGATNRRGNDWTPTREQALAETGHTCAICGRSDGVEVHHIEPYRPGRANRVENLVPLCPEHHLAAGRRNSEVSQRLREIKKQLGSGEPGAVKVARPVCAVRRVVISPVQLGVT
jgi:RNA-directed DNA polymerase